MKHENRRRYNKNATDFTSSNDSVNIESSTIQSTRNKSTVSDVPILEHNLTVLEFNSWKERLETHLGELNLLKIFRQTEQAPEKPNTLSFWNKLKDQKKYELEKEYTKDINEWNSRNWKIRALLSAAARPNHPSLIGGHSSQDAEWQTLWDRIQAKFINKSSTLSRMQILRNLDAIIVNPKGSEFDAFQDLITQCKLS
jgi:hypothetical protein